MNKIDLTRFSQPQGACEINWSNPITKHLLMAIMPGISFDAAVNKRYGTLYGTTIASGTSIKQSGLSAEGLRLSISGPPLLANKPVSTCFCVASTSTAIGDTAGYIGGSGNAIYSERASSGVDIYKLGLVAVSGISAELVWRSASSSLTYTRKAFTKLPNDGRTFAIACVKDNMSVAVHTNEGYATNTLADTSFSSTSINRQVGFDAYDGTAAWNGKVDLVLGWGRALSTIEIKSLLDNPWQIFKPIQKQIFIPVNTQIYVPQLFEESFIDGFISSEITGAEVIPTGGTEVAQIDTFSTSEVLTNNIEVIGLRTETVVTAETNSNLVTSYPNVLSAVSAVDSYIKTISSIPNTLDSINIADVQVTDASPTANLVDNLSTSDIKSSSLSTTTSILDTSSTSDSSIKQTVYNSARQDTNTCVDIITILANYLASRTEVTSTADSNISSIISTKTAQDNINVLESRTAGAIFNSSRVDSLASIEVRNTVANLFSQRLDSNNIIEASTYASIAELLSNDTINSTDNLSVLTNYIGIIQETTNILESRNTGGVSNVVTTDTNGITDTQAKNLLVQRSRVDALGIADTNTVLSISSILASENISVIDTYSPIVYYGAAYSDINSFVDTYLPKATFDVSFIDSIVISDSGIVLIAPKTLSINEKYIINTKPRKTLISARSILTLIKASNREYTITRKGSNYVIVF